MIHTRACDVFGIDVPVAGAQIGRLTFQPGWRWSSDVKPLAKPASCEAPHFQYHVSGKLGAFEWTTAPS